MEEMEVYLLSVEELNNNDAKAERLRELAMRNMDSVRLEKVKALKQGETGNLAIGAGLLLQLAVRRGHARCPEMCPSLYSEMYSKLPSVVSANICPELCPNASDKLSPDVVPTCLQVSQVLDLLGGGEPMQAEYCYGEHGKPDFAGGGLHFNLSHSGQYVCCALAEEEVGIDIQRMRPMKNMRVAERFFSQGENDLLQECGSEKERQELFYRIWVRKEAYAKLSGAGIAAVVECDVMTKPLESVCWQELEQPEGYRMAVCRYVGGKNVL
ncbi:MAG: 4'-phosphopantetheinyl transferase superfamily protein [Butyrivibrio sp.]|nr:4'-phosphopantetheinyl transferase superfamily protein [Muribaculum sp.]MCM1551590.1 4'-phosphopantetheinyl transferase superfamily protein [Butyrivibrio sp.]